MRKVSMFLGLSEATLSLIFLGAFGAMLANALVRREWAWSFAMGLPLLFCAARAGLPSPLVAWGCALYAGGLGVLAMAAAVRVMGAACGVALIAAAAMLGFSSGVAHARYIDLTTASLHSPPLIGVRLEALLRCAVGL